MEIINKMHPEILNSQTGKNSSYVTVRRVGLFFTKGAVQQFGLQEGKYIQFYNDGKNWEFWQSEDESGFLLQKENGKRSGSGLFITNKALVKMFLRSLKMEVYNVRFGLFPAQVNDGKKMIEINTKKTYEELMKNV